MYKLTYVTSLIYSTSWPNLIYLFFKANKKAKKSGKKSKKADKQSKKKNKKDRKAKKRGLFESIWIRSKIYEEVQE